ncbi:MAG: hypothetical protein ABIM59_04915 [candidate division WOR-3 bacterium]
MRSSATLLHAKWLGSTGFTYLQSTERNEGGDMLFCPIAPIAHLDKIWKYRSHMVLPQLWEDSIYRSFYKEARERGDFVVLDNGAYEGTLLPLRELCRVAADLRPTVIVLPDVLGDYQKTEELSRKALPKLSKYAPCMQVVQGRDLTEVTLALMKVRTPWVGLPRLLGDCAFLGDARADRRPSLLPYLRHKLVHLLGWVGDPRELDGLHGVVSVDTAAPIWRGLHGYSLYDTTWPDVPFDPHSKMEWCTQADINLAKMQEHCELGGVRCNLKWVPHSSCTGSGT